MATCKRRLMPDPLMVPRCKICSVHTDILCSGCQNPICRLHNAAPATSFYCYCAECRTKQVLARLTSVQDQEEGNSNER
jgi:hypothetical protein